MGADRLSIWPVEGGRYGIDAHYFAATGTGRAEGQERRPEKLGMQASVHIEHNGCVLRLGPLAYPAAWLALETFIGRPPT